MQTEPLGCAARDHDYSSVLLIMAYSLLCKLIVLAQFRFNGFMI